MARDKKKPEHQKFENYLRGLRGESERGIVLVATAYLDDLLTELLSSTMHTKHAASNTLINSLFSGNGALASFWSKTCVARGFGLLEDWLYRDLEIIRKLRNRFAHQYLETDFDDPQVVALTCRLKGADLAVRCFTEPISKHEKLMKSEELRFRYAAAYDAGVLVRKIEELESKPV